MSKILPMLQYVAVISLFHCFLCLACYKSKLVDIHRNTGAEGSLAKENIK